MTMRRHPTRIPRLWLTSKPTPSSPDMDKVLSEIARAAAKLMEVPFVAFWIPNESAQALELRAVSDECLGADFLLRQVPFGEGGVGWVAAQRCSLHLPNIFDEAR